MLEKTADFLWGPWTLALFLLTGGYYSLKTGLFQIWGAGRWLGAVLRPRKGGSGGLSQYRVLSTALASTVGTGSIAGVATAIFFGGPGAVFWMWVSALLGMMTGFAEKTLAVRYRVKNERGEWLGGAMLYMSRGLGAHKTAALFSLACLTAAFGAGNTVQSNSIASAMRASFGVERPVTGLICTLLAAAVILGGIGRISRITEAMVPGMALLFLAAGLTAVFFNRERLPAALAQIFACALAPRSVVAGGAGYGAAAALRWGVARGVFTNEAGLGSSAMVHAAADVREPAEQGLWGIFEVFASTMVVCTVSALVILTAGIYDPLTAQAELVSRAVDASYTIDQGLLGVPLATDSFSVTFGAAGGGLVSLCLTLFAFSSILGWSYYGERALEYLVGHGGLLLPYRIIFLGMVFVGAVADLENVWRFADICNGLMALPNLACLLALSPEVLRLFRRLTRRDCPGDSQ